jgi:PTS system nitrogen regulatory IIA component
MTSSIIPLLFPDCVLYGSSASSKKQVFNLLSEAFENAHGISKWDVCDALLAREKLGSTGLGLGVAIPHGRIKGLKQALGAFAHLAVPVDFGAPDGEPVDMVFVLLVPEKANETHLELLSELAQMFSDKQFRESIRTAQDTKSLHLRFASYQSTG